MKLTVGFAHVQDFHGAYFTVQSIRLNNLHRFKDIELLAVDNDPGTPHSKMLEELMRTVGGRYIPMASPIGTSPARNRIFEEATGDLVMCLDSHVILPWSTLDRIFKYTWSDDLYCGPLYLDGLDHHVTHYNDVWGAEMWGKWGVAYVTEDWRYFSTLEDGDRVRYIKMGLGPEDSDIEGLPDLPWVGHELELIKLGYRRAATGDLPFEVPGQGLGLFISKKDSWLGFNEHARYFGGEELCVHEKYRQAGRRTMCLPWLKWVHRFGRPEGPRYSLSQFHKVRNYVLWFNELNMDLAPIHKHFVEDGTFKESTWNELIKDPIANDDERHCASCNATKYSGVQLGTLDELYDEYSNKPRDLDQHMPKLRELAEVCEEVVEFSERQESTIAFLAAGSRVRSYNTEKTAVLTILHRDHPDVLKLQHRSSREVAEISDCDLLFIDQVHTYAEVSDQLTRFGKHSRRYIVMHDTDVFGLRGADDGSKGILTAAYEFMRANPEWSVVYHTQDQYGLTVLSCDSRDKEELPGKITMAKNFASAMAKHVASGGGHVTDEQLEHRLQVCTLCPHRNNDRCTVCGCFISAKAALASQDCPLNKWQEQR